MGVVKEILSTKRGKSPIPARLLGKYPTRAAEAGCDRGHRTGDPGWEEKEKSGQTEVCPEKSQLAAQRKLHGHGGSFALAIRSGNDVLVLKLHDVKNSALVQLFHPT